MNIRPKIFVIVVVLVLLSLALVACERERPPATTVPTTSPRGTVAPSSTPQPPATQVILPGVTGAETTPGAVVAATPTAPAAEPVVGGAQPAPVEGAYFTYTVVEGDTLAALAVRCNVTQDAIVQLSGLTNPDALAVGQQLKIPGTAAACTAAAATTGSTSKYVVQAGDTLMAIARRFGTTVEELVALNGLANPDSLALGQELVVPATSGAGETTTGGATQRHVVTSGDTLNSIARQYGVTVEALQQANGITNPNFIYIGQELVIP